MDRPTTWIFYGGQKRKREGGDEGHFAGRKKKEGGGERRRQWRLSNEGDPQCIPKEDGEGEGRGKFTDVNFPSPPKKKRNEMSRLRIL